MPNRSSTLARSASVVAGVIRSTIEFGNGTSASIQPARAGSRSRANADTARRATSPLDWMLSQETTVSGPVPAERRRASASTR
jgi:hypothetical protein